MTKPNQFRVHPAVAVSAYLAILLCVAAGVGCNSTGGGTRGNAPAATATTTPASLSKGRAQIWGETCARCHNMRSPDTYSDTQWELVMQHMRVRGYLTGEEQRQILEFLKSAN